MSRKRTPKYQERHAKWYAWCGALIEDDQERLIHEEFAIDELCNWIKEGTYVSHLKGFCAYKEFKSYMSMYSWINDPEEPWRADAVNVAKAVCANKMVFGSYDRIKDTDKHASSSEIALRKVDLEASKFLAQCIDRESFSEKVGLEHSTAKGDPLESLFNKLQGTGLKPKSEDDE